uniref:NADH-ubiquinone oxidoreductase chain 6 n=1 Tax=Nosodendron fasciculare TaxID=295673 RepID=A0A343C3C4_9COLE|nr:NADH dehydrogenase subunit 6 [Nosodendron fasciculare]
MLMYLSLIFSIMLILMKHPMSMGMILMIQTITISMITGIINLNYWFSYILFLIMIGGMLILFIYMTSIASNEKFKFSNKLMFLYLFKMMILIIIMIKINDFFMMNMNNKNFNMMNMNLQFYYPLSMNKYLNFPSNIIMIMIIIYLFICLIAITKITNINFGPLRQKF